MEIQKLGFLVLVALGGRDALRRGLSLITDGQSSFPNEKQDVLRRPSRY